MRSSDISLMRQKQDWWSRNTRKCASPHACPVPQQYYGRFVFSPITIINARPRLLKTVVDNACYLSSMTALVWQVSSLERYRSEDGVTMHWRQFVLDEFVSSDITQEFLDNIRSDLETIRSAKFTTVTRILYVKEMPEVSVQFIYFVHIS